MEKSKSVFSFFKGKNKEQVTPYIIIMTLIAVVLVFTVINNLFFSGNFFSGQNFHSILLTSVTVGIIAIGECVAITAGYFDMSVGMVAAMGGLTAATVMKNTGSVFLSVMSGIVLGLICGLMAGLCVSVLHMNAFITTYAMQSVYRGIIYIFTDGFPISMHHPEFNNYTKWGQMKLFGFLQFPIFVLIVLYILVALFMRYRKLGRSIYLVGGNARCAEICGIKLHVIQIFCFLLCDTLAAIAGMLYASRIGAANAFLGETIVMESIASTIVGGTVMGGGKSNLALTFIGVLIVYSVKNGLIMCGLPDFYQYIAIGIILFVAVCLQIERTKN